MRLRASAKLLPLHNQLTWVADDLVQQAWLDGFFGRPSAVRVEKRSVDSSLMDPDSLDHRLVSYLRSCRNLASSELLFSLLY